MPKLENFIRVAESVAAMSKDPSTQVGAIAIDDDWNILCVGYNGFPRGVNDWPERLADRETKLKFISHSEQNLVAQAARNGIRLKGCKVIITSLPPCSTCTKLLIQAGVTHVYFPEPDVGVNPRWLLEWEISRTMLAEAGVEYEMYRKETK